MFYLILTINKASNTVYLALICLGQMIVTLQYFFIWLLEAIVLKRLLKRLSYLLSSLGCFLNIYLFVHYSTWHLLLNTSCRRNVHTVLLVHVITVYIAQRAKLLFNSHMCIIFLKHICYQFRSENQFNF